MQLVACIYDEAYESVYRKMESDTFDVLNRLNNPAERNKMTNQLHYYIYYNTSSFQ